VLGALAAALYFLHMSEAEAVTISFLTLAMAQLWHVFNMRARGTGIIRNAIVRNPFVWGALVLCTLLILAAIYMPGLNLVLATTDPGGSGWLLAAGMSLLPLVVGQAVLWLPINEGRGSDTEA